MEGAHATSNQRAAVSSAGMAAAMMAQTAPAQQPRINRLMLIDDNALDQRLYQRVITRSGLVGETISFLWAEEALAHLTDPAQPPVDLVLLDINMPQMDGFEFLHAASDVAGPQFAPVVVMLTTSLNPDDYARAMAFDAVRDFLNKPLTIQHLHRMADMLDAST